MATVLRLFLVSCVCGDCVGSVLCSNCVAPLVSCACGKCVHLLFVSCVCGQCVDLLFVGSVCDEYVEPVACELYLWRVCGTCCLRVVLVANV